ncbi:alpha-1,6-glucosidase domain-containing protein [Massilia sp. 9096]|uniref:alpha-1,6-glucosidase domain-containing protein n=1 Tax=Massilia sp. 9096 TaxID=1500894 RepID=UPI00055FEA1A|nr:alpha-1,6-glucosidase domain-containing protein [Massilia sp. 9096]
MTQAFATASLFAFLAGAAGLAQAAIRPDSCDSPNFQIVQSPAAATFDARAVWLDKRLVRWPGAATEGVFKLYHSLRGSIVAPVGGKVAGAVGSIVLAPSTAPAPPGVAARFKYLADGPLLQVSENDVTNLPDLHSQQLVLVREDADGTVRDATRIQAAGALDDLYAAAAGLNTLGVDVAGGSTRFTVWAPTARQAAVCVYDKATSRARAAYQMDFDRRTGAWSAAVPGDLTGKYYRYAVDVPVDGVGIVRDLVTDPYSVSLSTDSKRSYITRLDAPRLKPEGWDATAAPSTVRASTDMVVYETHVRDFSINDPSVPEAHRGKYLAFTDRATNGMKHLAALARAGVTDVHLLPVYDFGSVPEAGCVTPRPSGAPDSEAQQALVMKTAGSDCFNWGYDPVHYNAPEGSYATDPQDGAKRIVEFREMVESLHRTGLRVGMDVVFNHTFSAGQSEKSVLDRVVPGYYHRLNDKGGVEQSTCCDNTATENLMMGKLLVDSVTQWAVQYKIDSFRFDLMGHQPRALMEQLQRQVNTASGRRIELLGEGWNFGEVADNRRFVQASQLSLNGSGIGTFNDRTRDAVRGGGAGDAGEAMFARQGWINGLAYDPNAHAQAHMQAGAQARSELLRSADLVRAGLAGSIRSYKLQTADDRVQNLEAIDYGGQPAGYVLEPGEVVNYVENHDNQTLFDIDVFKLPVGTSSQERARVQVLGLAVDAFAQGVAYFHAGVDILRSKSLDRNSFNSGDWFNRVDWSYQTNDFGSGLPPQADNGKDWAAMKPLLANAAIKPTPADIAFARDAFRDLLAVRTSSTLFRLSSAAEIKGRLRFFNTGGAQEPTVVAAHLDGNGYPGANFKGIHYFINVDKVGHTVTDAQAAGKALHLHPVFLAPGVADKRATQAAFDAASGAFSIPPRTAVVFVED